MYQYWSHKETSLLKKLYPKLRVKNLAKMFPKRTKATIIAKALSLNLPSAKFWQSEENGKLSNVFYISYRCNSAKTLINYLYTNADLYLERKFKLAKQCSGIKIKPRRNYTKEENRIIQQLYHSLSKDKILLMLPNRSWPYIQYHAWQTGLTKNKRIKKKLCT